MQTNWLTAEQQAIWRAYLHGTARVQQYLDTDLRRFGLTLAEYEILTTLSETPERKLRMSELADAVHQSRSRLTHTVTRLENSGQLTRTTCAADGRGVWAELTDAGYRQLVEIAPHHVEAVRRILIDQAGPADLNALGRTMRGILSVAD